MMGAWSLGKGIAHRPLHACSGDVAANRSCESVGETRPNIFVFLRRHILETTTMIALFDNSISYEQCVFFTCSLRSSATFNQVLVSSST